MKSPYHRAQVALAGLKSAALDVLGGDVEGNGLTAEEIGRILGTSASQLENSELITIAVLRLLEHERLCTLDAETDTWSLKAS